MFHTFTKACIFCMRIHSLQLCGGKAESIGHLRACVVTTSQSVTVFVCLCCSVVALARCCLRRNHSSACLLSSSALLSWLCADSAASQPLRCFAGLRGGFRVHWGFCIIHWVTYVFGMVCRGPRAAGAVGRGLQRSCY